MANPSAGTREFLPLPSIARATIDCLLELESLNRTERARIATWAEEVLVFGSPNECLQVQLESNPPAVQKVCAILHDILIAAQDLPVTDDDGNGDDDDDDYEYVRKSISNKMEALDILCLDFCSKNKIEREVSRWADFEAMDRAHDFYDYTRKYILRRFPKLPGPICHRLSVENVQRRQSGSGAVGVLLSTARSGNLASGNRDGSARTFIEHLPKPIEATMSQFLTDAEYAALDRSSERYIQAMLPCDQSTSERERLIQRLRPFICIYPACERSKWSRETVVDWASHLKEWHSPAPIRGRDDGTVKPGDALQPDGAEVEKAVDESAARFMHRCPFCWFKPPGGADLSADKDFQNHVALHMVEIAVMSIYGVPEILSALCTVEPLLL